MKEKKKIALLHFAYPPNTGGVELLLREHARILIDLNFEVTVITGSGQETNPKINLTVIPEIQSVMNFNPNLQDKILKEGIIDQDFYELSSVIEKKLEASLKSQEVIIIHNMLTIVRNLPFIYALKNYAKNHPEKKIIAWTHDHSYINQFKIKKIEDICHTNLERQLLTTPIPKVKYIVISESFKKPLVELLRLKNDDVQVIYNGISFKYFLEIDNNIWDIINKYSIFNRFPIILSPVNILGRKKLEYGIEIVSYLRKFYPDIIYIITGNPSKHHSTDNYFSELKKQTDRLKIQNNILFLTDLSNKALSNSEIHDFYTIADIVFMFSESENFGLPLIESFLTKTAIFTSDIQVFHEIGNNFVNYIDYQTVKPEKAAYQIYEYLENSLIIKANYQARKKFNLNKIIEEKFIPLITH